MFWDNFVALCAERGVSPNAVTREIGLSSATATNWKNGANPRDTALRKIADYFGVTKEELLSDKIDVDTSAIIAESSSEDERLTLEIVERLMTLSESEKTVVRDLLSLPKQEFSRYIEILRMMMKQ